MNDGTNNVTIARNWIFCFPIRYSWFHIILFIHGVHLLLQQRSGCWKWDHGTEFYAVFHWVD